MKKLLVVGYVWPEPNSSAAGSRMLQLLSVFKQLGYQIYYSSPAVTSQHMVDLKTLEIEKVEIELNNSSFDVFVSELQPEIVLFDRFMMEEQFSWRIDKECPNAIKILETVDLHCLRNARHEAVKNNVDATNIENLKLHSDVALREVASILRCDLSLMISNIEMDILKNTFQVSEDILFYLPFMYQALNRDESLARWTKFEDRNNFITIGNFRHEPNWDSVLYLKNSVWPRIRAKLKKAELHIYGAYLPKKAQQLHNEKQGFIIKGWANDALETMSQHRVCLSPLRFGAGMKGKLADAMLTGTPSVTTEIGAESMYMDYDANVKFEWPGFIEQRESNIAESAIALYEDKTLWQDKQNNSLSIVNNVFNKEKNENKFIERFNTIKNNLEEHRDNNFTGKMLRHHTMKSAMYMSQWIEAKNKITNN